MINDAGNKKKQSSAAQIHTHFSDFSLIFAFVCEIFYLFGINKAI